MAEFKPFEMIMRIEYGGAVADGDAMQVCCKAKPVAELVRCRDCIYAKRTRVNDKGFTICEVSHMDITDNDFCSYGERKDGERRTE